MLVNIDEVATLVLADAISATGRLLIRPATAVIRRRNDRDLAIARWFDTYRLTDGGPALPDLAPSTAERLTGVLRSDEVQAVLQELLATHLTNAAGVDVRRVQTIWEATFSLVGPDLIPMAENIFSYYDNEISEMVKRLERHDRKLLNQIREDAQSARIIAILNAIERHTAALTTRFDQRDDKEFLTRYRRQVVDQHGKIEPPDFERRRRVPISDIYVPTAIYQGAHFERPIIGLGNSGRDLPDLDSDDEVISIAIDDAELDVDADLSELLGKEANLTDLEDDVIVLDLEDEVNRIDLESTVSGDLGKDIPVRQLDLHQLAREIDRIVLLGDPGAGKTTAANVLAHNFASDDARPVPFVVTLRDFAAQDPPRRSVVEHIEHTLGVFYQCPGPPGCVDRLLLTGRALVIFDGLDELLDTARRADVSTRVERFCAEYPLARILVTSRVVGYEQARLDDRQFTLYQLGGFSDKEVYEYVHKWFTQESDIKDVREWASSFLKESASIPDLRTNPLLLSLLCILYRGEGSLPRKRSEVYEQCAKLLFDKWDARRRIHQNLQAGHLIEPTLQHLAWWLFTRDQVQSAVTERELVKQTTAFLHGPGFESEIVARTAAVEFVEFCRGRMWVFSDAGTTASGENLYSFTHRTFMEYFAAAYLAYGSDSPEQLARTLDPHVSQRTWDVVAEISIQIKDRTSSNGARRIYTTLLEKRRRSPAARTNVLDFLAMCLRSVDPSPQVIRKLTRQIVSDFLGINGTPRRVGPRPSWPQSLSRLLASGMPSRDAVADEIVTLIGEMADSGDAGMRLIGLRFGAWLPQALPANYRSKASAELRFWTTHRNFIITAHASAITAAAQTDGGMRRIALEHGYITIEQALEMHSGLLMLVQSYDATPCPVNWTPYLENVFRALRKGWPEFGRPEVTHDLEAIGRYLLRYPATPWIRGTIGKWDDDDDDNNNHSHHAASADLSHIICLGAAAVLALLVEVGDIKDVYQGRAEMLGPLEDFYRYIGHRQGIYSKGALPKLPIPEEFDDLFRKWASRRLNMISTPHAVA
jgi:hypothetical protein